MTTPARRAVVPQINARPGVYQKLAATAPARSSASGCGRAGPCIAHPASATAAMRPTILLPCIHAPSHREDSKTRRAWRVWRSPSARMAGMIGLRILAVTALVVLAYGCGWRGMLSTPAPPAPPAATAAMSEATVPEWRVGDRWVYEWTSGQDRGTRTLEVRESTAVNGVEYYVVEIGPASQQYYTKNLHFAAAVQASRVLARMVPPQPWFVWPLKAAAQWSYQGVYEERGSSKRQSDAFGVVGIELVTVPRSE